uniref:DUF3592 domain-containing protein n=1 Tax=Zooxanthella nutricula TaxID=1333877 RepID=A0A6U6GRB8_9DINO
MVFWENDLELSSLAYGLLLGFAGACLSALGLAVWASILHTKRNAAKLLGAESDAVVGKVLGKEITPKAEDTELTQVAGKYQLTKTYYLVHYVFDAVRAGDGVTCRVEVRDRKVPSFVWMALKEGEEVSVRCLKEEPRQCRVAAAAEFEQGGFWAFRVRACIGLALFAAGLASAILCVLDHHIAGGVLYLCAVLVAGGWFAAGRKCLQAVFPRCRPWLQSWSPLWVHAGYVIQKELGKGINPGEDMQAVIAKDITVGLIV